MQRLEIARFKAFYEPLELQPEGRNLLVYGDNGTGKTSLCEALRLLFFHRRLVEAACPVGLLPARMERWRQEWYDSFRHRRSREPYYLAFDGTPLDEFRPGPRRCFLFDHALVSGHRTVPDPQLPDGINLKHLLEEAGLPPEIALPLLARADNPLVDEVNRLLEKQFYEDIRIGIENDRLDLYVEQPSQGLRSVGSLHACFNEARIRLVRLLLVLAAVATAGEASAAEGGAAGSTASGERPLLVLDDVMSSLDAGNRLFLVNYLLLGFGAFQLVVLTHNVGLDNIFDHQIRFMGRDAEWQHVSLYMSNGTPRLSGSGTLSSAALRHQLECELLSPHEAGLQIRRRFEQLLTELSKFLQTDAAERASSAVKRLAGDARPLYVRIARENGHTRVYTADDLVATITRCLGSDRSLSDILDTIGQTIAAYTQTEQLPSLSAVVRDMTSYQRLLLHQLSHGSSHEPQFSEGELKASLDLLGYLEECLKQLKRQPEYGM